MLNVELSERPAYSLTAGELADLIISRMNLNQVPSEIQEPSTTRVKVNGIRGLAEYMGCSIATAQKIKNSGKLTCYEKGSRFFFFSDEVDEAIKTKQKR